jgi:hypothetical protein
MTGKRVFDTHEVTYKGQEFVHCRSCNTYGRPRWAHLCRPDKPERSNWEKHPQAILDREARPLPTGWGSMPYQTLVEQIKQRPDPSQMVIKYGVQGPSSSQPRPAASPVPYPYRREDMLERIQGVISPDHQERF